MSFVGLVSEEQAEPFVKNLYQQIRLRMGFIPNYYLAMAKAPKLTEAQMVTAREVFADGALSRVIKEQIALVVSGINSSSYCVAMHMEELRVLGIEKALGRKLATNYAAAPVGENVQVLFRFADKLTRRSADIEKADVDAVRAAGWSEDQLFETVVTVAFFNFTNRFSIGLGLVAEF